jgi:MFS family permease
MSGEFTSALREIRSTRPMLLLGLSQSFYEGAVYTFVFMWVPVMQVCLQGEKLPTGLVFSCFMLSMTLGGFLSGILVNVMSPHKVAILTYFLAAAAMLVPIFADFAFWPVFVSFLVLESTVGMFGACGGILRSQYFPGHIQSSVMSVFRVVLNALVVVGTYMTSFAGDDVNVLKYVFGAVVAMLSIALALQVALYMGGYQPIPEKKEADVEMAGKSSPRKAGGAKKGSGSPRKRSVGGGARKKSRNATPKKK